MRHDAEHVAPPPHLSYVAGDRGTHQRGEHPRQRKGREKRRAVGRGGNRADQDIQGNDEKSAAQPLQRAASDEDNDRSDPRRK